MPRLKCDGHLIQQQYKFKMFTDSGGEKQIRCGVMPRYLVVEGCQTMVSPLEGARQDVRVRGRGGCTCARMPANKKTEGRMGGKDGEVEEGRKNGRKDRREDGRKDGRKDG